MALIPIVLGAASLAQGLFGKKPKAPAAQPEIDISAELAKLDALYGKQRELLTQSIGSQTNRLRKQTATSLANRGIFSSPVSEKSFNETNRIGQEALTSGLASLYGNEATATSAAMNNILGYNQKIRDTNYNNAMLQYVLKNQGRNNLLSMGVGSLIPELNKIDYSKLLGGGNNEIDNSSLLSLFGDNANSINRYGSKLNLGY